MEQHSIQEPHGGESEEETPAELEGAPESAVLTTREELGMRSTVKRL
jgi:hypothetical protein